MKKFEVKNPAEMSNEDLLEVYPTLCIAAKLYSDSISTTAYQADIKAEILKRMEGKQTC